MEQREIAYPFSLTMTDKEFDAVVRCVSTSALRNQWGVVPRLHDHANIEQSSSKHPANAFKIHVQDECSNCLMFAQCLLDACFMIAWSCV